MTKVEKKKTSKKQLPPELVEKATDSPALKRARRAFLDTIPAHARPAAELLITSPSHRKAFNEYRAPKAPTLAQAKEAFDGAQVECVKACLEFAGAGPVLSPRSVAAQNAGMGLIDAYAAILRARDAELPAPVRLTTKGERAKLKPVGPKRHVTRGKRRGSK